MTEIEELTTTHQRAERRGFLIEYGKKIRDFMMTFIRQSGRSIVALLYIRDGQVERDA